MTTRTPDGEAVAQLMEGLADKDGTVRQKARASLVALGTPAVASLSLALRQSELKQVRWEAAKALGAMNAVEAIPSLVIALDDRDNDVSWLAAEALENLQEAAWPELLDALIERGADSIELRQGAHHVMRNARKAGLNDDLAALRTALESSAATDTPPAAGHLLMRMRERSTR